MKDSELVSSCRKESTDMEFKWDGLVGGQGHFGRLKATSFSLLLYILEKC